MKQIYTNFTQQQNNNIVWRVNRRLFIFHVGYTLCCIYRILFNNIVLVQSFQSFKSRLNLFLNNYQYLVHQITLEIYSCCSLTFVTVLKTCKTVSLLISSPSLQYPRPSLTELESWSSIASGMSLLGFPWESGMAAVLSAGAGIAKTICQGECNKFYFEILFIIFTLVTGQCNHLCYIII